MLKVKSGQESVFFIHFWLPVFQLPTVLAPYQVGQRLQLKTVIFRHEEAHMDPGREAEIVAEAKSSG